MLLFNNSDRFDPSRKSKISKHLMLLFNVSGIRGKIIATNFKTSHVIV